MKTAAEEAAPDLDPEAEAVDATIPANSTGKRWKTGRASMLTATCVVAGGARSPAPVARAQDRGSVEKSAGTPPEVRCAGPEP